MDHAHMDHSKMDHSAMDHGDMGGHGMGGGMGDRCSMNVRFFTQSLPNLRTPCAPSTSSPSNYREIPSRRSLSSPRPGRRAPLLGNSLLPELNVKIKSQLKANPHFPLSDALHLGH